VFFAGLSGRFSATATLKRIALACIRFLYPGILVVSDAD
jgi:hypothetical protein